jgi:hypothetical protein
MPFGDGQNMNIRIRTTGNLNLSSETGDISLSTNSANRFMIDLSVNIYSFGDFDISGHLKSKVIYGNNVS